MNADRHTTEQAPETAVTAPRSASTPEVGVSGGPDPLNGPQKGAQRFRGQQPPAGGLQARIAAVIRDTPAGYPDDIAAAVWQAVEQHLDIRDAEAWCKTCRRVWEGPRHRCESDAERRLARLRDVASTWFVEGEPGPTRNAGKFLLGILDEPAHNAGPSIRECAQADAAHWNDKYAGEGQ